MMDFITSNSLLIANLLASALLLARSLLQINCMDKRSNHAMRLFYVVLAVGAAGVLLGPLYGYTKPQPSEVLCNFGAAGLLWSAWVCQYTVDFKGNP